MMTPTPPPTPRRRHFAAWLVALSGRHMLITVFAALLCTLALSPIFSTPFVELLGRILLVAMVLLLTYTYTAQVKISWLPRWVVQLVGVVLAAPLATLLAYGISVSGNWNEFFDHHGRITGFVVIAVVSTVMGLLFASSAMMRERESQFKAQALALALAQEQLERQSLHARLGVLQAQIQPHFLLNTLANVQALVASGSPRAAPVFASLIAYLRATMPRLGQGRATLGDELSLVRSYLALMDMRMPDRLQTRFTVSEALLNLPFPPMALLTLVENAVRHGIDPQEDGGCIEVGASQEGGVVTIWVSDTGTGMPETALPGTGLTNLRERLQVFFGPTFRISFEQQMPHGLRVELAITPAEMPQ